ncbi:MAG: hypothetical protein RLZ25_2324 [Pseudomonadota bacterium]
MSRFHRFIGVDYSGAATPNSPLPGLRVFESPSEGLPFEVRPSSHPSRHWTRQGVAEWLLEGILGEQPVLIGIDHGFSFPSVYFDEYGLSGNWDLFLNDFCAFWPSDQRGKTVRMLRESNPRRGDSKARRHVEILARAKSVFHFDVPGSVASSTHAGLPWLRWIRERAGCALHFWPYDGTLIPDGCSVIAEAYPALWFREECPTDWSRDQWDAFLIAEALAKAARSGVLSSWFAPQWPKQLDAKIEREGWILGFSGG